MMQKADDAHSDSNN